jgi:DNA-binding transcriptional MerR regulator
VKVKGYHPGMFHIARFAGLSGVSAKMLRDYDRLGIFKPVWVDASTGYRSYSPAQLPEIRRIVALRDLGVGLAEIKRIVSGGADLSAVLDARRSALEVERREVDRRLAALDISVSTDTEGRLADIVVRDVEPETVAVLEVGDRDVGQAFYELEAYVRDVGRRGPRPPSAIVHEAPDGSSRTEVFVPIRGHLPATDAITVRRLPRIRAATIIARGSYSALPGAIAALDDWISAAGQTVTGPLRILYLQFGAEADLRLASDYLVDRDEDFVTELQRPVA